MKKKNPPPVAAAGPASASPVAGGSAPDGDFLAWCRPEFEAVVALRRDLHAHPETGFDVERTAGVAAAELARAGVAARTGVGRTGVVGDLFAPGARKTVALRADMDALPMDEVSCPAYRSMTRGKAHMCGHDAHTAMLIGAARVLARARARLRANVRFIFQPSEEQLPGGAPAMMADGALDGVDEIFGLHVWPTIEVGSYGVCPGPAMAQPDNFRIAIAGVGGHAAYPKSCRDPIVIGAQIVAALQTIVARNVDPQDAAVVSVTTFHAGSADNVISHEAVLGGTVRTYRAEVKALIRERMETLLRGITAAFGATFDLQYVDGYPVTINHDRSVDHARRAILGLVDEKRLLFPAERVLGGEDFGYYVQKVPGCFVQLGCRNEKRGFVHLCHDPRFDIDEECLLYGMALHVALAMRYG